MTIEQEVSGWYVERLIMGHWHRDAVAHYWAKERDARQQLEDLRRRYPGRVYRLSERHDG